MLPRNPAAKIRPLSVLVVYSLALVTATHWPSTPLPSFIRLNDKLLHLTCYAFLGLLAYWAFVSRGWLAMTSRSLLTVTISVAAFGAVDELTQYYAPGRSVDAVDWLVDICGGFLGAAIYEPLARLGLIQKLGVGGR